MITCAPSSERSASADAICVIGDYSGVVLETGNNSQFQKGQEVFGMVFDPNFIKGTLASHIVVNPFEQIILPKPSTFNFREAAAVPLVWITGYTALIDYGRLVPDPTQGQGKTVAVIGASGGTGDFATQLFGTELMPVRAIWFTNCQTNLWC